MPSVKRLDYIEKMAFFVAQLSYPCSREYNWILYGYHALSDFSAEMTLQLLGNVAFLCLF